MWRRPGCAVTRTRVLCASGFGWRRSDRVAGSRRDECHTTGLWARPYYHQVPERHDPCGGNEEWKSLQLRWKEEE